MGSTIEPDRKRRHISSISSPTAATKNPFRLLSEEKKLDLAVLQFQNQKLMQKSEAQKVEIVALEEKCSEMREKQKPYEHNLQVVNNSWEKLVGDLESRSITMKEVALRGLDVQNQDNGKSPIQSDDASCLENDFLSRLLDTGATDSSSSSINLGEVADNKQLRFKKNINILSNIVSAIDHLWSSENKLYTSLMDSDLDDGLSRKQISGDLRDQVLNLRKEVGDLSLKHRSMATELLEHQDKEAMNKAEINRLRGELEKSVAELEECNTKLAAYKAQRDAATGMSFPVLNIGNKHVNTEKFKDKNPDLQEMESLLKDLMEKSYSRLEQLKNLHEERVDILKQLANLQNSLKSVTGVWSSQAYNLLKDQVTKAKADISQYQALLEKLQVEKESLAWREKEMSLKNEVLDVFHQSSAMLDSRKNELTLEIHKCIEQKKLIETKLEQDVKDQSRKDIIDEFKALNASFPEEMENMQRELGEHKEGASEIHILRAKVASLSSILNRKTKEMEKLHNRSDEQNAEMGKLQAMVDNLKQTDSDLKMFLDMFRLESPFSSEVNEAREREFKAWARVQSLKNSFDEHNLEFRVKSAIEAEATSQQKLGAAEADIIDLRQIFEASKRERSSLPDVLKSKNKETKAYLSEIETISQAYEDMQSQNQQLLRQITERDDSNIKLVLEGIRGRQTNDAMLLENQNMERATQRANATAEYYNMKAARIDDHLKVSSDQVQRLAEGHVQNRLALENTQKRLVDTRKSTQRLKGTLKESQSKVEESRLALSDMQITLEKERFERKRAEEDLEALKRKAAQLKANLEGTTVVGKLRQELNEYKDILKCTICLERRKEVVISKCFHLFCNPCVQKVLESRHRKCPTCTASFGPNDIKPVYI